MSCRNDTGDPRKCDRCGEFLWVIDDGMFCGECGVTMPCTMQVRPVSLERPAHSGAPERAMLAGSTERRYTPTR
jgi:hypothetical protein